MLEFDALVSLTSVPCVSVSLLAVVCLYLVNRAQGKQLPGFILLGWAVSRASVFFSLC